MSRLVPLAPRPAGEVWTSSEQPACKNHSKEEWSSRRGVIEQLYINEGRKLVEIMTIMASKHGFAATEQMYKKRFKKWNLRKRGHRDPTESHQSPCHPATAASESAEGSRTAGGDSAPASDHEAAYVASAPISRAGPYSDLELMLGNVRSWSSHQLETTHVAQEPMARYLASPDRPPLQDSRTMYRTFELVFDLWAHGQGQLAGLAARKAFYALEFVLEEDHPDLVWHILDSVYDMVDRGHMQLLDMFLRYATELSSRQLPREHPLPRILQQLVESDYSSQHGRDHVCHLLRSAWHRNVDILSGQIGSETASRLWLFEQLIWDGRTRLRRSCRLASRQETFTQALASLNQDRHALCDMDVLRIMALTLEYTQMDLKDRARAEELALDLLSHTNDSAAGDRSNARFHAYARKMLARLQEHRREWASAEQNLKFAVEKREAAHGHGADLRVIRDMWVLAGHYSRSGQQDLAERTVLDAVSRADSFLKPVSDDDDDDEGAGGPP